MASKQFPSFKAFYPYYLSEHSDPRCRRLHYIGTSMVLILLLYAVVAQQWALLLWIPLLGYGPAWIGHFFFENNKPATFQHPLYSLMGDFVMLWQALTGQLEIDHDEQ